MFIKNGVIMEINLMHLDICRHKYWLNGRKYQISSITRQLSVNADSPVINVVLIARITLYFSLVWMTDNTLKRDQINNYQVSFFLVFFLEILDLKRSIKEILSVLNLNSRTCKNDWLSLSVWKIVIFLGKFT